MKASVKLILSIFLLSYGSQLSALNTCEIWTYNYTNYNHTFYDTAYGNVWDRDAALAPNDFQSGSFVIEANYETSDGADYGYIYDWLGYGVMPSAGKYDTLGIGLYKISTNIADNWWGFYLDLRDSLGSPIDIRLRFENDLGYGVWSWQLTGGIEGCEGWHSIANGDTVAIYEMWATCDDYWTINSPDLAHLQPIDPYSLSVSTVSGHPHLSWSGTPELDGVEKYTVYRGIGGAYNTAVSNLTSNSWTDTAVESNRFGDLYQYKVRTYSGDGNMSSDGYSNVVTFTGDGPLNKKVRQDDTAELSSHLIASAYPNPFNPSTIIAYTLPDESDISLQIFDVNGRVVYEYSHPSQSMGNHAIEWRGNDKLGNSVKTGMYFARIKAGQNTRVLKLIYLK
ncbi:MAG: T9SS type A sorting domain-containing protein [FCB group bacterium]|nr:T9SS type A sorting domain-containing protein [FCB group bacterium]